jgi:CHAT domain-containing protein
LSGRGAQRDGVPSELDERLLRAGVGEGSDLTATGTSADVSDPAELRSAWISRTPPAATSAQVQALLPPGVALLECCMLGSHVLGVLVTRSECRYLDLGMSDVVREETHQLLSMLDPRRAATPLAAELSSALRGLGRRILDPCRSALPPEPATHTIVFCPDEALARIPLEALLTADVAPGTPEDRWPFLVRDCAVIHAHSATAFVTLASTRPATPEHVGRTFVAFAHPDYGTDAKSLPFVTLARGGDARFGALPALPGTAEEVAAIAELFATDARERAALGVVGARPDDAPAGVLGERFALFLRRGASEANLRGSDDVGRARILHLACHGSADETAPSLSHLALSRPAAERHGEPAAAGADGYVFAHELAALELRADLLVLSACETHAGSVTKLEGVDGLSRAGFAAGARAVLATLWRVPDVAARDLVVGFYRSWIDEGLARATALAKAKREAIARGVPIAAWSSFVLWDADVR